MCGTESVNEGKQRHKSIKFAVILNLTHETECAEIPHPLRKTPQKNIYDEMYGEGEVCSCHM